MSRATLKLAQAPGFLPYGRHAIDEDDIAAVAAVLRSDYLTTGPTVEAFERAFANVVEAPYAIACANGTAALHLAMLALEIGPGDVVIAPTITFLASANCARFTGADIVFADVDPDTALMTPATLRAAIARVGAAPIKAVIAVHFAGGADTAELAAIAAAAGAVLVEDACHAIGSRTPNGVVGDCAHAAMTVFSFHPVKTIATGEGGMITTRDPVLARRLGLLRGHGMVREPRAFVDPEFSSDEDASPAPWAYEMQALGFNYRLSDIHAALGLSQLRKLERFSARRRALAQLYSRALAPLAPLAKPLVLSPGACPHLFVVLIDFAAAGASRAAMMARLKDGGIGTQVHYMPVHRQPYYRALYGRLDLPGAELYYRRCLSVPLFATMCDDDVLRVVDALASAIGAGV